MPLPSPHLKIWFAIFVNFGCFKCDVDVLIVPKSASSALTDLSSAIDLDFQKILSYDTYRALKGYPKITNNFFTNVGVPLFNDTFLEANVTE